MFYSQNEEKELEDYFTFANDTVGILALALGSTALGFENPKPFAWFYLAILVFWLISKQGRIKYLLARYNAKNQGIKVFFIIWKAKIYMIGLLFLACIATGIITESSFYNIAG